MFCRFVSTVLGELNLKGFDIKSLRAFRVLRPLRLVSGVPSKSFDYLNVWFCCIIYYRTSEVLQYFSLVSPHIYLVHVYTNCVPSNYQLCHGFSLSLVTISLLLHFITQRKMIFLFRYEQLRLSKCQTYTLF